MEPCAGTIDAAKKYVVSTTLDREETFPHSPCFPKGTVASSQWDTQRMKHKTDVWQGTLALMVLKTLNALGPQHGWGIARRIEQTSNERLSINPGTLYPVLLKLEQEGSIDTEWGVSDNNRKAKFYRITKAGKRDLDRTEQAWERAKEIVDRFQSLTGESA